MAKKTVCDLWNEFEEKRDVSLKEAAIRERDIEIENIEYDICSFGLALNSLDLENIRDIKKIDDKFVISFKDDSYLHQLLGIETPEGVEFYDNGRGFKISVVDNNPEMLDEYFGKIVKSVEAIIDDHRLQIAKLKFKWRQTS